MREARYKLEPYKGMTTRYICPSCKDGRKTFVRYIDIYTGSHIAEDLGKCNRTDKCGYHKLPPAETKCFFVPFDNIKVYSERAYQLKTSNGVHYLPKSQVLEMAEKGCYVSEWYLKTDKSNVIYVNTDYKHFSNGEIITVSSVSQITNNGTKSVSLIPVELFKASLKGYEANHFVTFLTNLFGVEITNQVISKYFIATSKHWEGATLFWQIDITGAVRTGKIMLYSPTTGKRVKEPYNLITWVHKSPKLPEFVLKQCLFGEHLLKDEIKPVAIVESEKTAIIASVYLPQFIWLAVGGKENLNLKADKFQVLKGRLVVLFPDLKGFEKWNNEAKNSPQLAKISVSDLLESNASETDKEQGLDLSDYLIRYNHKDFALPEPEPVFEQQPEPAIAPPSPSFTPKTFDEFDLAMLIEFKNKDHAEVDKPEPWDKEIKELESCFNRISVPESPIRLNSYSIIEDPAKFIHSHLEIIKSNNGNSTYLPYLKRLQELMQLHSKSLNR